MISSSLNEYSDGVLLEDLESYGIVSDEADQDDDTQDTQSIAVKSNGIQDLLKLEAIQAELAEYNGSQPTFPQSAAAAGTDDNTLQKRLDYGIHCKNRMVTSNVRLVISIAREFEGPGLELYDLFQVFITGRNAGPYKGC